MNFDNFFNDAKWRSFSPSVIKATGAYPNRLYHNANEKLGVVVAFRGAHNSWALNETAVNYIRNAVRDGRIAGGYAILARQNAANSRVLHGGRGGGNATRDDIPDSGGNLGLTGG